jgi:hypothetical protein
MIDIAAFQLCSFPIHTELASHGATYLCSDLISVAHIGGFATGWPLSQVKKEERKLLIILKDPGRPRKWLDVRRGNRLTYSALSYNGAIL